ncbi:energy transducer TonB [Methylobacterium sp. 77]|uniref:energy transducer TonB family protein n=1 Tax=Methylobacterium sp. 77 TaxID=1101192 RepID=UPI00036B414E|nr:energy transducer TonB [Methylobacterium sp. 77]
MSALVSTREPGPQGPTGLAAAFLVAFVLHLTVLAGMMLFGQAPKAPPGENTITIDLAPQSTEAEAQAPAEMAAAVPPPSEVTPTETPETVDEVKPPEMVEVKPPETAEIPPDETQPVTIPDTVAEVPPEDQVVTSTAEIAEPLAPPPPVVAKPPEPAKPIEVAKPKPKPKPDPRIEAKRQEQLEAKREAVQEAKREAKLKAAREASKRQAQEGAGRSQQNSASSSRQSSAGAAAAGNDPSALRQWQGALASAINGRMNRNAAAGTAGGTAVVRFTVSRSGQVLSAGLASSSGISVIDGAALAAVRGSLPAAPAGVTVSSLAVTVPMRFRPGG